MPGRKSATKSLPKSRRAVADTRSAPQTPPTPRFLDWLRDFETFQKAELSASQHTVAAYRRDLTKFGAYLARAGVSDVNTLTFRHAQAFAGELAQRGYADSTRARHVVAVRVSVFDDVPHRS